MQGTANITMADPKPPSPEDTAQTIASIEAQLDDLLDAIDQHQPAQPAPTPTPAAQAMPPTPVKTEANTELDEIADALEAVGSDAPEPDAVETAPAAADAPTPPPASAPDAIAPDEAQAMLAEVNDALAQAEQAASTPPHAVTPEPTEAEAIDEPTDLAPPGKAPALDPEAAQQPPAEEPAQAAAEAIADVAEDLPEDVPMDAPEAVAVEAPAEDLDAEIEALLAESSINDEVLAAADEIAQADDEKAQADQEALALRAASAKQNLMSRESENAEALLGAEDLNEADLANTQEQIAQEIEDLLAAEGEQPAPAADEPSIDQIDQMLADEIDTDDELIGDFQSVEDVAEGIVPSGEGEAIDLSGEPEGASASDVASELDSQPEDLTSSPNADADEPDDTAQRKTPKWKGLIKVAEPVALRVCWTLNWPLRQNPVTPQWRATIGYVALLNLAVGSALFAVGVAKLVF